MKAAIKYRLEDRVPYRGGLKSIKDIIEEFSTWEHDVWIATVYRIHMLSGPPGFKKRQVANHLLVLDDAGLALRLDDKAMRYANRFFYHWDANEEDSA
jgi:hypothetical protein